MPMQVPINGGLAMKTDCISIGARIRDYRKKSKLTQETLAEKVDVNKNFIYMLENNQRTLSLQLAIKIANALNISLDELFADELSQSHFSDYYTLFEDCDYVEREVLTKILQEIKKVLHNYTIK